MARKFSELVQTGLNANNVSTVSNTLDVSENQYVSFSVEAGSGAHLSHVVTLQCSLDDSVWVNTSNTISRTGMKDNVQTTVKYVRLKVTGSEGSPSTINVIIQAK